MTDSFYGLTTDTILDAVDAAGFSPTGHCLALNSLENRVYDLKLEDGSHVVVKFYRPGRWSAEQLQQEHDYLFELQAEEIPVCAPLRFSDGNSLRTWENIYFAIWPRTGGRMPDEFTDSQLMELGRLIARMHNVGSRESASHRITLNADSFGRRPLEYLLTNDFLPEHIRRPYEEVVLELCDIYDRLSASVPIIRIHGDAHGGNLLRGDDGWFFLDFDDFCMGPAVQDIWLLAGQKGLEGMRNRSILLQGYRQFREFSDEWLQLVEPLRSLRFIHYSYWIAKRIEDPAFPTAFPHFGTEDYWANELNDLQDQMRIIKESDVESVNAVAEISEEEAELSNKDFFWDWED
ncbi:MAG: serine/threonine protein kinase [Leptospiraceae bacterium]|nr:serine/threonine protein kinase [Leptospiraceae bacterium]MCB1302663.1 serine/threonine protein kinase [Leptospiraceae bacterium]